MTRRLIATATILVLVATAASAAPPAKNSVLTLPISGSFTDAHGGKGAFTGTFKLVEFAASGNQILANGYITGTLTDSTGVPVVSIMRAVSIPTTVNGAAGTSSAGRLSISTNATCDILGLVLGPLHLDVLGLTVDLNQVVLDIAAQTGAGNLLGNLLCAVVSLLDGAGALVDIAQLLNRILDIIGGILG